MRQRGTPAEAWMQHARRHAANSGSAPCCRRRGRPTRPVRTSGLQSAWAWGQLTRPTTSWARRWRSTPKSCSAGCARRCVQGAYLHLPVPTEQALIHLLPVAPACAAQADWLRLNIGAILFQQHACAQAVKQFRMALDAIPPTYRRLRLDTTRNIGLAFVQAGRYQEAVDAFTAIVQDGADHHTAFNLVLCAAAQRDATLMRQCFTDLLQVGLCRS